ncbi:ROK family protein [Virgibacillus halophilus]|uniref:ROK family protein n=1 Tax=Tigheibacillus halophilus TaxID=361280 RepID=A0ABU5C671_9BACI|nr:ROK family protein [Virgibacillus halophilus]
MKSRSWSAAKKTPTKENIDQAIAKQVEAIVSDYSSRNKLSGIGISTAGIVNRDQGEIAYAGPTIKDYRGTNFKKTLAAFDLPVHVENDVNAALLGERWKGAAAGEDNVFCITLGTGIGGAWFDGGLLDGAHFQANSVGYLLYERDTQTNFEMRASTSALNHMINSKFGNDMTAKEVFKQAKQGDGPCETILSDWTREIAAGLAQIILIADPGCIIIGGGVSAQGAYLLEYIQKHIPAFLPEGFMKTDIRIAQLYNDAALYGAVYPFFK